MPANDQPLARLYRNFDLLIERADQTYRAHVIASPAGEATTHFTLPFSIEQLKNSLLLLGGVIRDWRAFKVGVDDDEKLPTLDPKHFGAQLFQAVFAGQVGVCLQRSLDAARTENKGLRIRLRLNDTPELAALPWEYLFDAEHNRFLTLSEETPLVRYLELTQGEQRLQVQPPLRLLVLSSDPSDVAPRLNVEREWQRLQEALAPLLQRHVVTLERLPHATLAALQRTLRRGEYHLFHFIGHGWFNEATGAGGLLLEDAEGKGLQVTVERLAPLLHDHRSLRLAFLNACEGAQADRREPFAGVAQYLVQQGLPAVIAMQFAITDRAAITLAQDFYQALADGYPVDTALAEARKAIYAQGSDMEWGTPVLFSRSDDNQLFAPQPLNQPQADMATMHTAGGTSVQGNVTVSGGDFVGRDKITVVVNSPEDAAKALGQAQARSALEQPRIERKTFEPETVLIPAGSFWMGSDDDAENEKPRHRVTLSTYRIGKYPVTNREYAEFLKHNKNQEELKLPDWLGRTALPNKLAYPVVGVSWHDASAYCAWLSQETGRTYRLPTEAEWEKAARGVDGQRYPWGNEWVDMRCNVGGNATTPVTAYPDGASPYGCLDLLGNMQEWTQTIWGAAENTNDYPYPYDAQDGREEPAASPYAVRLLRVHRGGSFRSEVSQVRSSARAGSAQETKVKWRGFRVMLEI